MIELGQHAVFIVWAYVGVAAVALALTGVTAWRSQRVKARLAALEAQGIRRRSESNPA